MIGRRERRGLVPVDGIKPEEGLHLLSYHRCGVPVDTSSHQENYRDLCYACLAIDRSKDP